MRWLSLAALALGLLAVGCAPRRAASPLEMTTGPDAVTALEFVASGGEQVRLERREGVWSLSEPLAFPADENTVSGMASALWNDAAILARTPCSSGPSSESRSRSLPSARFRVCRSTFPSRPIPQSPWT